MTRNCIFFGRKITRDARDVVGYTVLGSTTHRPKCSQTFGVRKQCVRSRWPVAGSNPCSKTLGAASSTRQHIFRRHTFFFFPSPRAYDINIIYFEITGRLTHSHAKQNHFYELLPSQVVKNCFSFECTILQCPKYYE